MSDEPMINHTEQMKYGIDVELSPRELQAIGIIVALWGRLEYEIFCQTLMCFGAVSGGQLPKEMNNMQFSQVLELWETHVVGGAVGQRKEVLEKQSKSIHHYHDSRNALVHGMWDWSRAAPERITATRIRKKEVVRTHFTANDLESFALELATINFAVRYPGGPEQYATEMTERGSYVSRRGVCLMTSSPLTDDLFRPFPSRNNDDSGTD